MNKLKVEVFCFDQAGNLLSKLPAEVFMKLPMFPRNVFLADAVRQWNETKGIAEVKYFKMHRGKWKEVLNKNP